MVDRIRVSGWHAVAQFASLKHVEVTVLDVAVDWILGDARAPELPGYIENLHVVEREYFGVDPTEIELPSWL